MELDELHGSLTTYKMTLQGNDEETTKKKKKVALKSSNKSNFESESNNKDEYIDLIMKQFQKFLKRKKDLIRKCLIRISTKTP
jgi:predicted lysophospholipase L1 biosynthesis ABC-type transport system permease subunit